MRNIEDYHISPPILEACRRLGITSLAEFLRTSESAFQEILVPAQMVELYSLVDSYNLKWGTQEERERMYEIAYQQDRTLCSALTYSILEMSLRDWETAEAEYAIHPEMFEDLTQYDSEGRPFYDDGSSLLYIPECNYSNFTNNIDDSYDELTFMDPSVCILLESRKFVRRKEDIHQLEM